MTLLAGATKRAYTPQRGFPMAGFMSHPPLEHGPPEYAGGYQGRTEPAHGALDDLYVRALVVADDRSKVGIASIDTLVIHDSVAARIRARVARTTGIAEDHLLLSATHTHAAPDWIGMWDAVPADEIERIEDVVVETVIDADQAARPAAVGFGVGSCPDVLINRRHPAGPIDPRLGVLAIRDLGGHLLAVLLNFACHPIVLGVDNRLYSADYPGVLCATVEHTVPGTVALFLQGTSGNLNPVAYPGQPKENLVTAYRRAEEAGLPNPRNPDTMRRIGLTLAKEALSVIRQVSTGSQATVEACQVKVPLSLKPRQNRELFCRYLSIAADHRAQFLQGSECVTEIQALRIGDVSILGLPGEPFAEIGLGVRRRHRERHMLVLGCSNQSVWYIPTDADHDETRYENIAAIVAPGSQALVERASDEAIACVYNST